MFDSILKAVGNAFRAPPVPTVVPARNPVATETNRMVTSLAIAGALPVVPITNRARDPFSIEDRVLNPLNPLAIAGADPLRANIWWD